MKSLKYICIIALIILIISILTKSCAYYNKGETLDPNCFPEDKCCTVK